MKLLFSINNPIINLDRVTNIFIRANELKISFYFDNEQITYIYDNFTELEQTIYRLCKNANVVLDGTLTGFEDYIQYLKKEFEEYKKYEDD